MRRLSAVAASAREALTTSLTTLLALQVGSGILIAPVLTLFPVYVERQLGLSPAFSAQIRALSVVAGGVMALAGGAACDLLGRKRAYLLAMTGVTAAGLLFLLGRPWLLYPLGLYAGLMFGLGAVAGLSYVMESAPRERLAVATGLYFLTGTLGNAAGSAAAGWIARELPNGYALLGAGMVVGQTGLLVAAALLLRDLPRTAAPPTAAQTGGGYGALLRRIEVWCLLALRFLPTVYWGAVTFLMPLLLFRLTGSEKPPGYYSAASLVVSASCQLGMGRIVDHWGVRVPALAAIGAVSLAALGQALSVESPAGLVLFGLFGAGAAWSLSITMTTLVRELAPEATRARLLGLTHVAWSGGFLAGTLLGGYQARLPGGGQSAFLVSAACGALATACAVVVVAFVPGRSASG